MPILNQQDRPFTSIYLPLYSAIDDFFYYSKFLFCPHYNTS